VTVSFSVRTTAHFDRQFRKLAKRHPDLVSHYAEVLKILAADPFNVSRLHPIQKLESIEANHGQYRLRSGRFRFRYDIAGAVVYLKACSLRREDTYR